MPHKLKIAFAGTPELAVTVLEHLLQQPDLEIVKVLTQPDRHAGRGRKIRKSDVKVIAEKYNLAIQQPAKAREFEEDIWLGEIDVLVVVAYGLILPASVLCKPRYGCINVHTSLLPRWRGAAPIQRAIENGDRETGVTIMQMDEGLDTGDILAQQSCQIEDSETSESLHAKLAGLGAQTLADFLEQLGSSQVRTEVQEHKLATYAAKISKEEAEIDWSRSALEIDRKVRAFNPAPVCFTELNGLQMRVWRTEILPQESSVADPGTIVKSDKNGIQVSTGDQILRINQLQLPGKKVINADAFHNGHPDFCPIPGE